ncbi:MAG: hypothetical protein PHW60_15790 [Kiritimatiellae bacterium]|nr:hypothetical protein [Kiritimatiellia bacterium]
MSNKIKVGLAGCGGRSALGRATRMAIGKGIVVNVADLLLQDRTAGAQGAMP